MDFQNTNKSIVVLVVCLAAMILTQPVMAGEKDNYEGEGRNLITSVPRSISYQGILKDSGGDPVADSVYSVMFRIFNVESGGTSLWDETVPCTTSAGVFDAALSNVNLPFDEDYWLELEVGGEILDPRQKMHMVGYAAVSDTADYSFATATGGNGWVDDGNYVRLETSDDSIGIGTATPTEKLDVNGNIRVTGKANIGSGCINTGSYAFVAGKNNQATYTYSTIGGGAYNTASGNSAAIAGGVDNSASGFAAMVGGGSNNIAGGWNSAVCGGGSNTANGTHSFAAGNKAKANHNGSMVISANSSTATIDSVRSGGDEQIVLRADGGLYITNTAQLAPYNPFDIITTRGGAYLSGDGTTWTNACDRNKKENFTPIDGRALLDKLTSLEITEWNYREDHESIRHIGPVAQEFYAVFGLGKDDKSISTVDPAGVALASIKELIRENRELRGLILELEKRITELENR
ncbi:MAG: tail fiber domain-containing protein [Candidatus Zixiibacteriota bacterium]|nr:MAG: tail fiber domain-containing protein [candidate division Zixibacteria bacterium]